MERYRLVVPTKLNTKERKAEYAKLDAEKKRRGWPTYYKDEASAEVACNLLKQECGLNIYVTPVLAITYAGV